MADAPPAQLCAALVAHSLTLVAEMPPAQAGTSTLAGIAIHAVSEASRLQVDIEAQSQKLLAWQEAQEIALRPVMRLYPPGAGFMSTTDFAKRLREAGLQSEREIYN